MLQICVNGGKSSTIIATLMLTVVEAATAFGDTEETIGDRGRILSTNDPRCALCTHTCRVKLSDPMRFVSDGNIIPIWVSPDGDE